ncbi:MAG: dienelactone hydrolase family protein [Novosphingobium sp.]
MIELKPHPYGDGETPLSGWLAMPEASPRASVLIFPTIANLTPRVAEKAALLARMGYIAFVADYYGDAVSGGDVQGLAASLRKDSAVYRRRLGAALDALAALPQSRQLPRVAIGFCMGGQAALEMARAGHDLAAVVSFHGLLETSAPARPGDRIIPRILVCHGDKDPLVPRSHVQAFMQEMDGADARWHLHVYSTALHGFTDPANDDRPIDAVAYDASADRQSWAAMTSLFDEIFN